MNELRECPFCRSKVEMKNVVIYPNMERAPAYIRCKKCNYHIADYYDDDLIQRWNNRPVENALLRRAEKAEARVNELEARAKGLEERAEKAEAEVRRLQDAWLMDEKIQPDGSLRPSTRNTRR